MNACAPSKRDKSRRLCDARDLSNLTIGCIQARALFWVPRIKTPPKYNEKRTHVQATTRSVHSETITFCSFFTALHAMQTRSSDENSVCPSVRPSVTRVDCDKTVERSVQIYIPYERTFSLVF